MTENPLLVESEGKVLYPIVFEKDFSELLPELDRLNIRERRVCIVTETQVGALYLKQVNELLTGNCKQLISFVFPAGEASKNLSVVQDLYEQLILAKFDRNDVLLALGGGVVGDLTGYAAATYFRGIDFVQIPTSLLAQTDSSVGGKTGVDFRAYKNVVGAFHQPKLVYMNLSTLYTLSEREFNSGFGEIIKHGLIKDKAYLEWLIQNREAIKRREMDVLLEMIQNSCNIKRLVVQNDPKEQGERALLNYGHTLGHAIEKLLDFSLLHGECVAIGTQLANLISWKRGTLSWEEVQRISELYDYFQFPVMPDTLDPEEIIQVSKNDKKMLAGKIKFILLEEIGKAYIDRTVTDQEMLDAIRLLYEMQK